MYHQLPKDPVMLLSFINTKLRDQYHNLDQLCQSLDISRPELEQRRADIDYSYNPQSNQFI